MLNILKELDFKFKDKCHFDNYETIINGTLYRYFYHDINKQHKIYINDSLLVLIATDNEEELTEFIYKYFKIYFRNKRIKNLLK